MGDLSRSRLRIIQDLQSNEVIIPKKFMADMEDKTVERPRNMDSHNTKKKECIRMGARSLAKTYI